MKYLLIILSLFLIGCDDEDSGNSNISVAEYFSYNDSNQVVFYFFGTVLIDGIPLDATDWVAAFNDDAAIGAYVGAPQRVAVGYKMSDTMSASFAYQADSHWVRRVSSCFVG